MYESTLRQANFTDKSTADATMYSLSAYEYYAAKKAKYMYG